MCSVGTNEWDMGLGVARSFRGSVEIPAGSYILMCPSCLRASTPAVYSRHRYVSCERKILPEEVVSLREGLREDGVA